MESQKLLYLPLRLLMAGDSDRQRPTAALQELAASVRQVGILQPLTVQRAGEKYAVVSGNRRLMAARMAGLTEAPCILWDLGETELVALTENLQREDLHYLREAELLAEYLEKGNLSQAQGARRLGRSQGAVANKLRLLQHSPAVRRALEESGLSERHARALLRVEGEKNRLGCLREIAQRGLTVAQTEQYIEAFLENGQASPPERLRRRDLRLFLSRITREAAALGVPVTLSHDDGETVLTLRVGDSILQTAHSYGNMDMRTAEGEGPI